MSAVEYKLHYFNVRGAAEGIRLMMAYGKIPFEDKRYNQDQWKEFKPQTPNGQMPVLEMNGQMYPQSNAIEDFIADKVGLNGDSAIDKLRINGLVYTQQDAFKKFPFGIADEEEKKQKTKTFIEEVIKPHLQKIENGADQSSGFYLHKISRADMSILKLTDMIEQKDENILNSYPKVKKIVENVRNTPGIKEYLVTRPKTEY